jgi:hypothetical protein
MPQKPSIFVSRYSPIAVRASSKRAKLRKHKVALQGQYLWAGQRTIQLRNKISHVQGPDKREMSRFLAQQPRLFIVRYPHRQYIFS